MVSAMLLATLVILSFLCFFVVLVLSLATRIRSAQTELRSLYSVSKDIGPPALSSNHLSSARRCWPGLGAAVQFSGASLSQTSCARFFKVLCSVVLRHRTSKTGNDLK